MYPFFLDNIGSLKDYMSGEEWNKSVIVSEIIKKVEYYKARGISDGDKVLLIHGNNIRFFIDMFSLWILRASCVCLDEGIGVKEFDNIVKSCNARFAIMKDRIPEKLRDCSLESFTFIDTMSAESDKAASTKIVDVKLGSNYDFPAIILFTSGTTGSPKGVVHTFRSLSSKWESLKNHIPCEKMDRSLCLLPTHFGHGLICNCLYPLLNGRDLLILPKFDINILSKINLIIDKYNITYMSSVPSVWKTILKIAKPPKNNTIELVTCGSAPLSSALWNGIQQWTGTLQIWNTYGITETGSWIAGTNIENFKPKNGMIGYGWGANILISKKDSVDSCSSRNLHEYQALPPNEVGYIWVQTASLMDGYLNQRKMTDDVISGSWFFTGDLGYMDDNGVLFISGRVRNEINTGGIKVIPEDIDFLLEGHDEVVESCVFGMNDELMGEIVAAAVVINSSSSVTSADLVGWCAKEISDYKIPKVWYFLDEIPKTARGKVNRDLVSEYCRSL